MVISRIAERNPEIKLKKGRLELMAIIRDAIEKFWDHWTTEHAASANGSAENTDGDLSSGTGSGEIGPLHTSPQPQLSRPGVNRTISQLSVNTNFGADVASSPNLFSNTDGSTFNIGGDWSFDRHERVARRLFFDLPQDGKGGTMDYLAASCVSIVFNVSLGFDF